jgi:hypothetical protein
VLSDAKTMETARQSRLLYIIKGRAVGDVDQLPTSHVFRRVHIMQGSKFSTVYHQVSQVL